MRDLGIDITVTYIIEINIMQQYNILIFTNF